MQKPRAANEFKQENNNNNHSHDDDDDSTVKQRNNVQCYWIYLLLPVCVYLEVMNESKNCTQMFETDNNFVDSVVNVIGIASNE